MNKLFEKVKVGSIELPNRIIFAPMTTGYEARGEITPKSINFYKNIAKGGVGTIIIGDLSAQPSMSGVACHDDKNIEGLKKLVDAVHEEGALISAQVFHQEYNFAEIMKAMNEGGKKAAMIKLKEDMETFCNKLTHEQIKNVQQKIVDACVRSVKAGFDIIQIHGDRLIGMFSSPILNKRTDEYGGTLEGRAKFGLEVVEMVRKELPKTPIDYKLAIIRTDPPMGKGGVPIDEGKEFAKMLVDAGVDSFHVCLANHGNIANTIPAMGTQPYGCFIDFAKAVKSVVNVPVCTVGRIIYPEYAEDIIKEGKADLIAMGRSLICDPDWALKVKNNKEDQIRLCIMCNRGCTDRITSQQPLYCALNTNTNKEELKDIGKAGIKKHIVIIGGGPAGMESARVASLRGHKVTLFESSDSLGGQLKIATIPEHKKEMIRFLDFLKNEMSRLDVDIKLNTTVDAGTVKNLNPDKVIVATGATPHKLSVPGADKPHVITAWESLEDFNNTGDRIVVVGGGAVGIETAEYIAGKGKDVTLIEMTDKVGADESPTILPMIMELLDRHGVKILKNHTLKEVTNKSIKAEIENGDIVEIDSDTVIMATGAVPEKKFAKELRESGLDVCCVGDCASDMPRLLSDAVHEGYEAVINL